MHVIRSHKKATAALVAVAVVALAGVAYALLQKDLAVGGTISGEEATIAAAYARVTDPATSDPCTWSRTADKLTITATKVPRGVASKCEASVVIRNDSNVAMKVQGFTASSDVATMRAHIPCGQEIQPALESGELAVKIEMSNVAVGASGTLTGAVSLVDSASFSQAKCPAIF